VSADAGRVPKKTNLRIKQLCSSAFSNKKKISLLQSFQVGFSFTT
jgi:hypothetical protein